MTIRTAAPEDLEKIVELYREVARRSGGIARTEREITTTYVDDFLRQSLERGLILVAEHDELPGQLAAEIHAYSPGVSVFDHIFSNLTIVVHPALQRRKIGRTIFTIFMEEIGVNRHDIGRVELFVRETNTNAIRFYQSLGFTIDGRFEMRIRNPDKTYEADIPMSWQNPNFEFD